MRKIINKFIHLLLLGTLVFSQGLRAQTTETTYYIPDALGSPIAAMDEAGNIKWRKHYQPYGQEIEQGAASQGNRIGYTGHVHDRASGLTYMGARYYDPEIGRFLSMDPVDAKPEETKTFNRYTYANNSPYNNIDPDGKDTEGAMWNFSGGVFGFGFTVGYGAHKDDKGNKTHMFTKGAGKFAPLSGVPFAISFTVTHEETNADTVYELGGLGSQTATSVGEIAGGEVGIVSGKGYSGTSKGGGAMFGSFFSLSTLLTDSTLIPASEPNDMSFSDILSP